MKTIKVSEAIDSALDWLVAKCEGKEKNWGKSRLKPYKMHCGQRYSTDWSQGGLIIHRERIGVYPSQVINGSWASRPNCELYPNQPHSYGPTPLIAAMRCYCVSKLGDEVEVPEELV